MDEKEKIEKIMQELNMNSAQFAIEIGIQGSTLSHILNGRNKPSLDVLKKILQRFRSINPEWLILGIGSIYQKESKSQTPTLFDNIDTSISKSDNYIPETVDFTKANSTTIQNEIVNSTKENTDLSNLISTPVNLLHKEVKKIIVYYSNNTFEEFEPKS